MKLIAFVEGTGPSGGVGGMILDVTVKDKFDMKSIMEFVQIMKVSSGGMIERVTVVNPCKQKPDNPYIHPPIAAQANPDGSFNFKGKQWLELIIQVDITGEEE